jgi:hypothetical protein
MKGSLQHIWSRAWAAVASAILLAGCPLPPNPSSTNPAGLMFARVVSATYAPGEVLSVTVTLTASNGAGISALGLTEHIPEGWSFAGASGPAIAPSAGSVDTLDFAWLTPPSFPYTFAYMLQVPPDAAGTVSLSGSVEYRQNAGPYTVGEVTTTIEPFNPAGVVLERSHPTDYTPGATVTVTLGVDAEDATTIAALGVSESLPGGWTLVSVEADHGSPPDVIPATGASGTLEFAWLTVPSLPNSFRYTANIPGSASGTARLTGHAAYRQDGGPLNTDVLVSSLDQAGR